MSIRIPWPWALLPAHACTADESTEMPESNASSDFLPGRGDLSPENGTSNAKSWSTVRDSGQTMWPAWWVPRLPITNMEHQYLVTVAIPEISRRRGTLPMIRDADSQYYLRQEGAGLLVGPWERNCRAAWNGADPPWSFGEELFPEDLERLSDGLAAAIHRVPALGRAGIKRTVNGAISFSPDGRPIVGPLPSIPNFFVACGFLGGIAQGGGIGRALSEWILHGEPALCLNCVDVARFGDWTTGEFARERIHEIYPLRYEVIHPGLERKSGRNLKTTSIHRELLLRGAVMGQANGWERPLWFAPADVETGRQAQFPAAQLVDPCR